MISANEIYAEIEQCTDDTKKLVLLFDLATSLLNFDERRTQEVAEELGELAERLDDNTGRSYYHSTKGRLLYRKSLFNEANREFELACERAMLTDNVVNQATCLDSLGIGYRMQGEYEKSLEVINKALEIFKTVPTAINYQSVCYNNMGATYKSMNELDKAKDMFEQGIVMAKLANEERMESNLYNNLAAISIMAEKHDEGAVYATMALNGFRKINHKHGKVHALVFLGHCILGKGSYAEALQHYFSCIKLLRHVDHKVVEIQVYKGIGKVYVKMQANNEAMKNFEKALAVCADIHNYYETADIYLLVADIYLAENEHQLAQQYLDKAKTLVEEHNSLSDLADKIAFTQKALGLMPI